MSERTTRAAVPGQIGAPSEPAARPAVPSPAAAPAAETDGDGGPIPEPDPVRAPADGLARGAAGASPVRTGSTAVRGEPAPVREGAGSQAEAARGEHVHSEPAPPRTPQRHSVRGQVLAALREALLSGELVPGEVYSAPLLGARFGVSATPVREAMQQLAAEGAVETVPNRGFRVARRTPDELAELAELRALLEVPTVLALARSRPAGVWQALRPLAETAHRCAARGDTAGYAVADQSFHRALVEPGGNRQLAAMVEELCLRAWRAPATPERLRVRGRLHGALLDALAAGDLEQAETLLREQLSV
ncbi:GntR family transcriptional regulator [Streptomyces sp. XM4193]|uniref:GntR family transcriptional regulator n=1 Tax=Streptomyces sp. XM4193 TaxID=2929782 RepID=UPI001FF7FE8F|nr:GntR family transcriptional regulator [Streptomyces sp. XM4193]MCK1797142.1 GntR family transcriptional regulator [Streptomyces sp. XM4193]